MAAIVDVLSYHGASPVGVAITNLHVNFKRADSDDSGLADPVPIPAAGTAYSWRKYTKITVVSGLSGQIGNIRLFADEAPEDWANSVILYAGITPGYSQPAAGDEAGLFGGGVDINTYTSGSPLIVNASASAITTTGTGTQDYVIQQIGVPSTATSGLKTARRIVYRFDES